MTITRLVGPEFYDVSVGCAGGPVTGFDLYGSDPFFDDWLAKSWSSTLHGVHGNVLNEDPEGQDEIYAKARYTTPTGQEKTMRTNTVYGHFGSLF